VSEREVEGAEEARRFWLGAKCGRIFGGEIEINSDHVIMSCLDGEVRRTAVLIYIE
jgi:hypothetical protein